MRITTLLIGIQACFVTLLFAGTSKAQTLNLDIQQANVKQVFTSIEQQANVTFVYNEKTIHRLGKISLNEKNKSLQDVLKDISAKLPLVFKKAGNVIGVSYKGPDTNSPVPTLGVPPPLVTTGAKDLPPGLKDISGIVTDTSGVPIYGVTVRIKGMKIITSTDAKGYFFLRQIPENSVIIVSYVGFNSQEIDLTNNSSKSFNIILHSNSSQLKEVSVSTGYQELPLERATGSFAQVDNALYNREVSTDVISRLKGIVSGLNFDNTAGNSLGISIRGRSTLLSNTQPLIILDNFPYEGDINNINPNDVESITVLKDAAAASIWGTLAGNGVIVITTKKGKFNQPLNIQFNANLTAQEKPNLFYAGNQFLSSPDYISVEKMLFNNGFYDNQISDQVNYPAISPAVEVLNNLRNGSISSSQATQQLAALGSHDVRNDLTKYFYRVGANQQYYLSLQGGRSDMNYTFSVGDDDNHQNEIGDEYSRLTLTSNVTYKPIKNLEVYANINYINSNTSFDSNLPTLLSPGFLYPYANLADAQGNPLPINKYYSNAFINSAPSMGLQDWSYSPLSELRNADNTSNTSDIRINTGIKYTLIKGLNAEIRYQYEKAITSGRQYDNENTYTVRNLINEFSVIENNEVEYSNVPYGGILDLSNNTIISNYVRGQLSYNNKWRKGELNVIAGAEARQVSSNGYTTGLYGYNSETGTSQPVDYYDYLPTIPGAYGESTIPNNFGVTGTTDRYRSLFSNASYSYNDRYILSGSARFDQSNLFGVNTNQKGVPLWSTGFKWNIDKEDFYKIDWLPTLALRATYGYSGNVNKTVSAFTIAEYLSNSFVPANNYAYIQFPGDPDLTWEKIGMLNFGVDYGLKKIFSGSFEYYRKYGSDLIGNAPVAASTGFLAATGNFADITGKGFDLTLNSQIINTNSFKWSNTLLVSYAIDKVTKYLGGNSSSILYENIAVGVPFNSIFLNKFEGLNDKGDPQGLFNGQVSTDYADLNNLPNSDKQSYTIQPTYFGSFRNDFSYKRVTLSVNVIFKAGYYFLRNGINYGNLYNLGIGNSDFDKRWQKPGDELHTTVPAMEYPDNPDRDSFYANSTALISNASNVRLQDLNLSYLVDKKVWPTMPFKTLRFYLYLNNLGLIWKANKYGIDPDYQVGLVTPPSASVGLKIGL